MEEREPSPPPRIGVLADEVYHKVGAANDVTFVQALDGKLSVTSFHVSVLFFLAILFECQHSSGATVGRRCRWNLEVGVGTGSFHNTLTYASAMRDISMIP